MASLIGLKELREHLSKYERRVREGQSFIVMKRSRPIFRIAPVDDGSWETVVDFTKIKKHGIDIHDLLKRL